MVGIERNVPTSGPMISAVHAAKVPHASNCAHIVGPGIVAEIRLPALSSQRRLTKLSGVLIIQHSRVPPSARLARRSPRETIHAEITRDRADLDLRWRSRSGCMSEVQPHAGASGTDDRCAVCDSDQRSMVRRNTFRGKTDVHVARRVYGRTV